MKKRKLKQLPLCYIPQLQKSFRSFRFVVYDALVL
jgi:hypothetical protein